MKSSKCMVHISFIIQILGSIKSGKRIQCMYYFRDGEKASLNAKRLWGALARAFPKHLVQTVTTKHFLLPFLDSVF